MVNLAKIEEAVVTIQHTLPALQLVPNERNSIQLASVYLRLHDILDAMNEPDPTIEEKEEIQNGGQTSN